MRFLILLLFQYVDFAETASLSMGKDGEVQTQVVSVPPQQTTSTAEIWNADTTALEAPVETATTQSPVTSSSDLSIQMPHLATDAVSTIGSTGLANPMQTVVQPPVATPPPGGGNIEITATGIATRTASVSGSVQIQPYLYTRNSASFTVHLYGTDGKEIRFSGKPLFTWRRADGADSSGANFKGRRDPSSMREVSPGDFSPRTGLEYEFTIEAGQKIRALVSGNPDPAESFLRLRSSAF